MSASKDTDLLAVTETQVESAIMADGTTGPGNEKAVVVKTPRLVERIRAKMKSEGWTMERMGSRLGVSHARIATLLRPDVKIGMQSHTLAKICSVLRLDPNEIEDDGFIKIAMRLRDLDTPQYMRVFEAMRLMIMARESWIKAYDLLSPPDQDNGDEDL